MKSHSSSFLIALSVAASSALLGYSDFAHAQVQTILEYGGVSQSKNTYCELTKHPEYFLNEAHLSAQRMSFSNQTQDYKGKGYLGIGFCWWHNRLQRAALYLTVFKPHSPKPTEAEAQVIFDKLSDLSSVVEITGYANWSEFSKDWESLLEKGLSKWQLTDSLIRQAWIRGASDPATPPGGKKDSGKWLAGLIEKIRIEVEEKQRVTFVKTQESGPEAHSLLIYSFKKFRDTEDRESILMHAIDSNFPTMVLKLRYKPGDSVLTYMDRKFLPYVERRDDFEKIKAAQQSYCSKSFQ